MHYHDAIDNCYAALREQGFRIYATALGQESVDLYDVDFREPAALVFGNEHRGVSQAAIDGADATVFIPMQGMVESLNISVAAAVSLYEAMRQRIVAGMYAVPELPEAELVALEAEWIRK